MIIIPDVHGRYFWKKPIEDNIGKEHIIFLGDYLDPYDYEGEPSCEVFPRFEEILHLKREHPDNMTLLLGNHDLHYVDGRLEGGRFDKLNGARNKKTFVDNAGLFQIACESTVNGRKYLFSHAGVLWGWLSYNYEVLHIKSPDEIAARLNEMWWDERQRHGLLLTLGDIPISRWGRACYGSPVWNDVCDMTERVEEIPGYYQIFGHSQQEHDPVITDHFACLDCRRAFRLCDDGGILPFE